MWYWNIKINVVSLDYTVVLEISFCRLFEMDSVLSSNEQILYLKENEWSYQQFYLFVFCGLW